MYLDTAIDSALQPYEVKRLAHHHGSTTVSRRLPHRTDRARISVHILRVP